jgi:mercuric ion binding protein
MRGSLHGPPGLCSLHGPPGLCSLHGPQGLLGSLALGLLSFGTLSFGTGCTPAAEAPAATLELQIGGMVCGSCAEAITAALLKLDGVRAADVEPPGDAPNAARAVVAYDPARVDPAAISAAISRLGYTATPP